MLNQPSSQPSKLKATTVIAHYKEPLDYLHILPTNHEVVVMSCGDIPDPVGLSKLRGAPVSVIPRANEGREAGAWLEYIVQHYDNLPDVVCFLQGTPDAGHTSDVFSSLNALNKAEFPELFGYFCANLNVPVRSPNDTGRPRGYLNRAFGPDEMVLCTSGGVWGGQHFVRKEAILRRPKSAYEALLAQRNGNLFANQLEYLWSIVYKIVVDGGRYA